MEFENIEDENHVTIYSIKPLELYTKIVSVSFGRPTTTSATAIA